ncbi:MAG: hypothetical protein WC876_04000 [Candidatus Thermoplasmatota archaeon]|jgi:hypothetical protein
MAKRKDPGAQTVVAETVDVLPGETHIHRTVREWQQHTPERLAEIEATIDSWDRRSTDSAPTRKLDYDAVESRVDKLTRRVKGSRKVVVQETVTEWVERPVEAASGSHAKIVLEPEDEPVAVHESADRSSRPKRRFNILGFIGRKSEKADKSKPKEPKAKKGKDKAADKSDADYQPQCAALTEDGAQCRNSARGVSRYCSSHKGYQPPTATGLAKRIEGDAWDPKDKLTDRQSVAHADTRPVVRKAKDTKVKVRKAPKKAKKAGRKKR